MWSITNLCLLINHVPQASYKGYEVVSGKESASGGQSCAQAAAAWRRAWIATGTRSRTTHGRSTPGTAPTQRTEAETTSHCHHLSRPWERGSSQGCMLYNQWVAFSNMYGRDIKTFILQFEAKMNDLLIEEPGNKIFCTRQWELRLDLSPDCKKIGVIFLNGLFT